MDLIMYVIQFRKAENMKFKNQTVSNLYSYNKNMTGGG